MTARRAALFSLVAAGMIVSGCTTNSTGRQATYNGPTKTIHGYLRGTSFTPLTPSSVVFVTAYDASAGNSAPIPEIGGTSFTLGRSGYFPVAYEIRIPAGPPAQRVALAVEIRRAGTVLFSNDRQYSQTTGSALDIPMREAPPRIRNIHGRL